MTFPVGDWQFWVVTLSAVGSLWMLVRPFLAPRGKKGAGAGSCSQCGVAAGAPCQGTRGGAAGAGGHGGREHLVVIGKHR
ncbi:MAG TPA: hypothetical protein VHQ65_10690 [Thermoanaerobaculia bacterium]|nr:hypothetical protein [Thermoanaerobaculia bacterium]